MADMPALPPRLRSLSFPLLIVGFYIASYPEANVEWKPWSNFLHRILVAITPENADWPRFSSTFGLHFIVFAIHLSPTLKNWLSSSYLLWFGRQSFAVYLLHGTIERVLLTWMVYGVTVNPEIVNEIGEVVPGPLKPWPGNTRFLIVVGPWCVILYGIAVLWTKYVDAWCDQVVWRLQKRVGLGSPSLAGPTPNTSSISAQENIGSLEDEEEKGKLLPKYSTNRAA